MLFEECMGGTWESTLSNNETYDLGKKLYL